MNHDVKPAARRGSRGMLIDRLWVDFVSMNPQAERIHRLLVDRGERVVNDHIALRTYGDARVGVDVLARPFLALGYVAADGYVFEQKKLHARHYEHPDPQQPKVFISALDLDAFSTTLRETVRGLIDQVSGSTLDRADLPVAGRLWDLTRAQYEALADESEYAAWVAAYGFRANHFTVFVNALQGFESLQALNAFLKKEGFALNAHGGEIKGSPDDFLEQSSTLADPVEVDFADGGLSVPGCYYEFARRYPLASGDLFQGFVAKSADRIFQSTDRR